MHEEAGETRKIKLRSDSKESTISFSISRIWLEFENKNTGQPEALKLDTTAVAHLIGMLEFLKRIVSANHLPTLASRGLFTRRKALINPAEVGNVPPGIAG